MKAKPLPQPVEPLSAWEQSLSHLVCALRYSGRIVVELWRAVLPWFRLLAGK